MKISALCSELRTERLALQARLDAIDLVLDNLARVYPEAKPEKLKKLAKSPKVTPRAVEDSDAVSRRGFLLTVIGKSSVGLTLAELRKQTPKMDGKDRSNALQTLKVGGEIKRVGNTWVKAA